MTTSKQYTIEVDPLAVALTRPPVFMGIPIRLFFANMVLCLMLCIDLHTLYGIPLFVGLHIFMLSFARKDLHFFWVWMKSFTKTPPVLNHGLWGKTNSYEPW